ncbi:MAG: magnesium chelatase [Candidatus Schekmanbacteria bacterium]|nr:MAG: magnesium chelatase [Candidatus Schekmanbacteria bacterium]
MNNKKKKATTENSSFSSKRTNFPFSAIVGQEKMKLALLLNAINPQIGGVLIRGERGTGKTIAVRGLTDVLPEIKVVKSCRFRCDPDEPAKMCSICREAIESGKKLEAVKQKMHIAELPVGATEDRVVGTLNIERAIKEGIKALETGILAEANRGILYIDNINLLDDHIMDVLLDSAAMGVNIVEREGVSISHPANFILVGTMNPEEGELRPQLHDRLAFHVEVKGISDINSRMLIAKRIREFEEDPILFKSRFEKQNKEITKKIISARKLLDKVKISEYFLRIIARMCIELDVDGHRPDIIITRGAKTKAAYDGRTEVTEDDVRLASELTLGFRMRRTPFEDAELSKGKFQQVLDYAKQMEEKAARGSKKKGKSSKKAEASIEHQ